jgi:hypothetical protein
MGQWRSFSQEQNGFFGEGDTPTGSCYGATDDGLLALTRGWGDVYRWQRPGQYVEFGGNGDGLYVVRTTVDKGNTTLETDETDNSAYALVRISARRIDTLERGWGTSPFDPSKTVFTGYGPASQDPYGEAPAAGGTPAAKAPRDSRPPEVTRVRARGGLLRFTISEAATVRAVVRRGSRVVSRVTIRAERGQNVVRLRSLRRHTRLYLSATDLAGNVCAMVTQSV